MVFQERTYGVLVVSASEKFVSTTMTLLPMTDYYPVDTARSVGQARRALLERSYDIVIVNAPLPDDFGMQLAIDVCSDSAAGVLLLVKSELYDDVYARVMEFGVLTLSKPTSQSVMTHSLRTLCTMRERMRRAEEKQASVEEKIEEIRLVNHAKWLLIQCLSMTEAEAHRYIEKQAMDTRQSKRMVAENIIRTYD